jgi:HEPN domain-containing protein
MTNRSRDWYRQSLRDLEQARESMRSERHEWACFASHQSAEKGVKALHLFYNQEAWGHVVRVLLEELPSTIDVPEELIEKARVLDSYYIPTRYANGHPEGAPFEHYGILQSREAVKYAGEIIKFCRSQMA